MTKMCLVVEDVCGMAKRGLPWSRSGVRYGGPPDMSGVLPSLRFGGFVPTGPRATSVTALESDGFRPRSAPVRTRKRNLSATPHPVVTRSADPGCPERHTDHLRDTYPARTFTAEPGRRRGTTPRPYVPEQRVLVSSLDNNRRPVSQSPASHEFGLRAGRLLCFTDQRRMTFTP
ncbi:hypothetical protein Sdagh_02160 [Streptomyces daghestanicus]|uniref:Uncharacterized protein n=1 Tax=Streptomyces daghestanicus TaxID=66885 RepID=A0ABQ3PU00_9ACTN|nr:hypothetical protein Sdagh_02160 [Streptomyces daghestanicus]